MISLSDHTSGIVPLPVLPRQNVIPFQKRVLIATPWQKQVSPVTAFCVAQLSDRRRTATALNYGDAFVAHSRNTCADLFLESDLEWMLTIDDDMVVPFGDAKWYKTFTGFEFAEQFLSWNALDRLMSHGKTLVGALYFGRQKNGLPMYNEGCNPQEAGYARRGPYDQIKPTRWVGTGCMLIHRKVFEDIEKTFPKLARGPNKRGGHWFTSTEAGLVDKLKRTFNELSEGPLTPEKAYKVWGGLTAALSLADFENPLGAGEDVSFCLRATAAGHQPYVDMGLRCGHLGHYVY